MAPVVSVIIVSYNTCAITLECLESLYADLGGVPAEVFVVDNASTDGSVDAIRAAFPQVRMIANVKNTGFGAANNQGMAQATAEFLLLLNSDAFPRPGAVKLLCDYFHSHPKTGVIGPRLLNKDGSLQRSCFRFPSPLRVWLENLWLSAALSSYPVMDDYRRWRHDREREVDWVIGACMLVRREVYEQVGGFDEHFFMYAEETDWQARIRKAGWKIAFTPDAQVVHLGGASSKTESAKRNHHFFHSLDLYERKNHGLFGLFALRLAMLLGCGMRFLAWSAVFVLMPRRRPLARAKATLHAWLVWRQLTLWRPILTAAR